MTAFQSHAPLKSLTMRSSLTMLLRTLYRIGLNYCVLPPGAECAYVIVFTKDQLVSLIERSNPEAYIAEIPKRVTQGLFKPVATFRPDSSTSEFVANVGFAEPEGLQVLLIEEDCARAVSLKEALSPRAPDFPEWWEAPVPFAMFEYGKVHLNRTAALMFGPDLKRMPVSDVPDKDEFLVMLESGDSPCSVTFHRLEDDIFVLEDSTGDISAAEEVAWWASVGKAWAESLAAEQKIYRRCGAEEAELLRSESEKNTVLPCEWEGELLGYFCVEPAPQKQKPAAGKTLRKKTADGDTKETISKPVSGPRRPGRPKEGAPKKIPAKSAAVKNSQPEHEVLRAIGPQTMGLLTPGMTFPEPEPADVKTGPEDGLAQKPKKPKKEPARGARAKEEKNVQAKG